MDIEKMIFNDKEIDFVVSIDESYIERNVDIFSNETIILNETINEVKSNLYSGENNE